MNELNPANRGDFYSIERGVNLPQAKKEDGIIQKLFSHLNDSDPHARAQIDRKWNTFTTKFEGRNDYSGLEKFAKFAKKIKNLTLINATQKAIEKLETGGELGPEEQKKMEAIKFTLAKAAWAKTSSDEFGL